MFRLLIKKNYYIILIYYSPENSVVWHDSVVNVDSSTVPYP